jgi:hypothetical protein
MARRATPIEPSDKELTIPEMHLAIRRCQRRIADLEAFDPTQVRDRSDPNIKALEVSIGETLAETFGQNTAAYRRYSQAAALDTAGINMNGTPHHEIIEVSSAAKIGQQHF